MYRFALYRNGFRGVNEGEGQILIFIVVFLSALFSLIYLKFGDKKIKCLKCSNLMWKDAHRCASCHWDYTYSYYESYESWDDFSKRNCLIKSLPCNAIKTYLICILLALVVDFAIRVWAYLSVNGDLKRFLWLEYDDPMQWMMITLFSIAFFMLFTGIFRDERRNSWREMNMQE